MLSVTRVFRAGLLAAFVAAAGSAAFGWKDPAPGGGDDRQGRPSSPSGSGPAQAGSQGSGRGQDVGRVRPWWKDAGMAREVGLTPEQVAKFDRLYDRRQKEIKPKVDEYNKQKAELERMIRERTAKPDEIEVQARRLSYPWLDIDISRTRMLYEMSLVLSTDQYTKMRAMFERMDQERRAAMERLEHERVRGRRGGGNNRPR